MRKLFSFLFGFLCGALIGAAIMILLTPESGIELRQQIQFRVDQAMEEGKRAYTERKSELESQLADLKQGRKPQPE